MNLLKLRRYINFRSVAVGASFILIANLGLRYQDQVNNVAAKLLPPYIELVTDSQTIYTIWIGLLAVHAAVGAVAPILGYTLMATSITNASRIAPSGGVVAAEIEWSRYLQTSLLLLAGSIIGMLAGPSVVGATAAAVAVLYVLVRTLYVFKTGFELIERPEKFDVAARKYLTNAIAATSQSPLDEALRNELVDLNGNLAKALQAGERRRSGSTLHLGSSLQATQLLRVKKRALQTLTSEAEKLGYQLRRVGWDVPGHLPRGVRDFLIVVPIGADVTAGAGEVPMPGEDQAFVDPEHLNRLQNVLDDSVVFGRGAWIENLVRAPMLVRRHIATVLYESIPREQPHDLEYGLDVLGQVIDDVQSRGGAANGLDLRTFDWIYDVPQFICGQISNANHAKHLYAQELTNFIRGRLVKWFQDPALDSMSRAYLSILRRLFLMFLSGNQSSAEYFAAAIRELPLLDQSGRLDVLRMIHRELVLLLIAKKNGEVLDASSRRLILKTIRKVTRFSTQYPERHVASAESRVSALAVALFLAENDQNYKQHVSEIIEILLQGDREEPPFSELLRVADRVEEVAEEWRWSWWELEQKERDEAHFLSIEAWLARAALLSMSAESWRLSYLEGEHIPNQQTLERLRKSLEPNAWISLLPESASKEVAAMREILSSVLVKREELIAQRVIGAPLDREKLHSYAREMIAEIRSTFGEYNEWLRGCGILTSDDSESEDRQYGVSRLLPKELFVGDEILDVPVFIGGTNMGSALVDFEVRKIFELLCTVAEQCVTVSSPGDGQIWAYVEELFESGVRSVWIIGVGISQYDVYEQVGLFQNRLDAGSMRFDTLNLQGRQSRGILVLDPSNSLEIVRSPAAAQEGAVFQESLPLLDGGVMFAVAEISKPMQIRWIGSVDYDTADEMKNEYSKSVLERIAWSFQLKPSSAPRCRMFELDPAEAIADVGA